MGSGCLQCTVNDPGWSACHDPHSVCVRGPLVGLRPCDVCSDEESTLFGSAGFMKDRILLKMTRLVLSM